MSGGRIEFANALRGIAALTVLFGHYLIVFNGMKGGMVGFPPLAEAPFPWVTSLFSFAPLTYLNPGPLAVATFFLVSGLVVPNATEGLAGRPGSRRAFVIGRLFRIYPTYAAGLACTTAGLALGAWVNAGPVWTTPATLLVHVSLFRDWLGGPVFDGVVWTLEVEAKFYLLVLLAWGMIAGGRLLPLFALAALALAAAPLQSNYNMTLSAVGVASFLWPLPFLLFMGVGVALNYHHRGRQPLGRTLVVVALLLGVFVIVSAMHNFPVSTITSYLFSAAVFLALYLFAKGWSGGPMIRFFADVSFPLYASHGMMGYAGLGLMTHNGWPPLVALLVQIPLSVAIAWIIHVIIERPTHRLGRALGRRWPVVAPVPTAQPQ